jgi:hypothetical protein
MIESGRARYTRDNLPGTEFTVIAHEDGLARHDIPFEFKAQRIQCHTFRRNHVIVATGFGFPSPDNDRPDAVRIAECHDAMTNNHRYDGITARTAAVYAFHCSKHGIRRQVDITLVL